MGLAGEIGVGVLCGVGFGGFGVEEDHAVGHDFPGLALVVVFVLPGPDLHAAFDVGAAALGQVLGDVLGRLRPGDNLEPGGDAPGLVVTVGELVISGNAELGHGVPVLVKFNVGS